MNYKLKPAIAIVLCFLMGTLLIGCKSSDAPAPAPTSAPSESSESEATENLPEETVEPQEPEVEEEPQPTLYSGDMSGYYRVYFSNASASSELVEGTYTNSAKNAMDEMLRTSWQESVPGNGLGEHITFYLENPAQVSLIKLRLGNARSDDWYQQNTKPQKLQLELGNMSYIISAPAENSDMFFKLPNAISADTVELTIQEVYDGTIYEDCCITEVAVYSENPNDANSQIYFGAPLATAAPANNSIAVIVPFSSGIEDQPTTSPASCSGTYIDEATYYVELWDVMPVNEYMFSACQLDFEAMKTELLNTGAVDDVVVEPIYDDAAYAFNIYPKSDYTCSMVYDGEINSMIFSFSK